MAKKLMVLGSGFKMARERLGEKAKKDVLGSGFCIRYLE
jgi:hypothetical protein